MKFKQHKEKKGKRGPEKGRGREGKEERKREEGREGEREVKKEGREREMEKPQPMNYSQYFHNKIFTLVNPWWLSNKESTCNAGDMGPISGSGRFPGEGNGNPLQYSCLGNLLDGGAWWAAVHGDHKSQTGQ